MGDMGMGWDGDEMGWDGMGWDGVEWGGMGWDKNDDDGEVRGGRWGVEWTVRQ